MSGKNKLVAYRVSIAGTLLAAREAVMAPIRPVLREAGFTEQQWRILRVLADEGPCDLSRLAAGAMLHAPSVTRILQELLERDLIHRTADPIDKRRSIVVISRSGAAVMRKTAARTVVLLDTYAARFGEERLGRLLNELRALTAELELMKASDRASSSDDAES